MIRSATKLLPSNAMLFDGFEKDCQIRIITTYAHYSRAVVRFIRWLQDSQIDPLKVGKKEGDYQLSAPNIYFTNNSNKLLSLLLYLHSISLI